MLRVLGWSVRREPLFRRGHRHRRAQGQRSLAAGAELGAVPGLGKRPLHRFVAALFFRESVLASSLAFVIARSEATKQSTLALLPDGLLRFARNDGYIATGQLPGPGESPLDVHPERSALACRTIQRLAVR